MTLGSRRKPFVADVQSSRGAVDSTMSQVLRCLAIEEPCLWALLVCFASNGLAKQRALHGLNSRIPTQVLLEHIADERAGGCSYG
jgi:hypothetical protein